MDAEMLLSLYRERGAAEGHQGELMSVLAPALSSSPRQKSHYRGKPPKRVYPQADSFAHNEVLLLLNMLAYNLLHTARVLVETGTRAGLSLKRLRERVLRIPARLLLHGRRAVLVIGQAAAPWWHCLCYSIAPSLLVLQHPSLHQEALLPLALLCSAVARGPSMSPTEPLRSSSSSYHRKQAHARPGARISGE